MSELMNAIYDKMPLADVIFRLPSKLAIDAIKRRIKDENNLQDLFKIQDRRTVSIPELKEHVNNILSSLSIDKIFGLVEPKQHKYLFSWLNKGNADRIKNDGKDNLTIEFLFNLTDGDDVDGLSSILDRILGEQEAKLSKVSSVLRKINKKYFLRLADIILKDKREYIRTAILSVNYDCYTLLTDAQKMVAVKALAKVPSSREISKSIQNIDFKLFKSLKPLERIMALDKYLDYFPKFKKIKVFRPEPTEEEFKLILFAGCFEYNDLVEGIVKKYKDITENEAREKNGI